MVGRSGPYDAPMRTAFSAACLVLALSACSGEGGDTAPTGVPTSETPGDNVEPSAPTSSTSTPTVDTPADSCRRVLGPDRSPIEVGVELVKAQAYGPREVRAARYAARILTEARETAPPGLRKLIGQVLELPQAVVDAVDSGANGFDRDVTTFADATRALVEVCRPYGTN